MSLFKRLFGQKKNDKKAVKSGQFVALHVKKVIRETELAVSLVFDKPESGFDFKSGQYLTLRKTIDGQDIRRAYSLSCLPTDDELKVTIKQTEDGFFSKHVNQKAHVGEVYEVLPPEGLFTYEAKSNDSRQLVAFAGGSGITPIFSILNNMLQNEENSRFVLVYGNRDANDIIFKKSLDALADQYPERFELIYVLSDIPDESISPYSGLVTRQLIEQFNTTYFNLDKVDTVFLCGPGAMISSVENVIKDLGFSSSKIKKELFSAPLSSDSASSNGEQVVLPAALTAIYDGQSYDIEMTDSKQSVLDAALDKGIKVPFSCLNGVCSTCSAKLKSGTVKMNQNFTLEREEIAEGYILTCQSHPTSANITVDWDDHRM